jgi:hypothetical protein
MNCFQNHSKRTNSIDLLKRESRQPAYIEISSSQQTR